VYEAEYKEFKTASKSFETISNDSVIEPIATGFDQLPPLLVLEYLFQPGQHVADFGTFFKSKETHNILRSSTMAMNKHVQENILNDADAAEGLLRVPLKAPRISHTVGNKYDLSNGSKIAVGVVLYSLVRDVVASEVLDASRLGTIIRSAGRALLGVSILEVVYRGEEYLLDTDEYYDNDTLMLTSSFIMAVTNPLIVVAVVKRFRSVLLPFVALRLVFDSLMPSFGAT